jgi:predicted transcriptional regulator
MMAESTTMTIRLDPEVREKLGRIARDTRRSRSFLAAEAVAAFVDREMEIIEGIQRGLADMEAGRVVPHEQVVAEGRAIIEAAKAAKKAGRG